jgi:hypothetical protein
MFVSQDKTTVKGRRKNARAAERADDQDEDSNSLSPEGTCARDERKSATNKNTPDKTKHSVNFVIR